MFDFKRNCQTVYVPFYIPACSAREFQLLHILTSTCQILVLCFNFSHSKGCLTVSHCSFNLHFLDGIEDLFMGLFAIHISFISVHIFCQNWIVFFFFCY